MQAVDVQTIESDLSRPGGELVVELPKPADEVEDIRVAPHPLREAAESVQRLGCVGIVSGAAHIAIDAIRIWPVGLCRHGRESLFANQPLRDLPSNAVELMGAMRSLANEH